jgi:RNA recognition motif-containing protein
MSKRLVRNSIVINYFRRFLRIYRMVSLAESVFVGGLPAEITEGGLRELLSQFGSVQKSTVLRDRKTKRSLGYGFVTFASQDDAHDALRRMHGTLYLFICVHP